MLITCRDSFGVQEISLPYSSLDNAIKSISFEGVDKDKNELKLSCTDEEETSKKFLIYITNSDDDNMKVFTGNMCIGKYTRDGITKEVYIRGVHEENENRI